MLKWNIYRIGGLFGCPALIYDQHEYFLTMMMQGSEFAWASLNCHYSLNSNSSFTQVIFMGAPYEKKNSFA